MRKVWFFIVALALAGLPAAAAEEDPCWSCHASTTPGNLSYAGTPLGMNIANVSATMAMNQKVLLSCRMPHLRTIRSLTHPL